MAPGKTYDDIQLDWNRKGPCRHTVACAEPWADINAFAIPASYTAGQAGRNILNGPGMFWHQFGLSKHIPITERIKGMLRVEFTAPFKYPFFSPPSGAGATVDFAQSANLRQDHGPARWILRPRRENDDDSDLPAGVLE